MDLNKYNNFLTYVRWSTKDPKDAQILDLVGVYHKLVNKSNKNSDNSNRGSTKVYPAYIRELPSWIMVYLIGICGIQYQL